MASLFPGSRRTPRRYKLTADFVEDILPNGKWQEFYDQDCRDLVLKVSPRGEKSWYYRYKAPGGKRPRVFLGHASEMTPTRARKQVQKEARTVDRAKDTPVERQQRKQLRTAISKEISPLTVKQYLDGDYTIALKEATIWWRQKIVSIKTQFGKLLDQRLAEFDRDSILKTWRDEKTKAGKVRLSTINRYISQLSSVFRDAVDNKLISVNPLANREYYPEPADHVRYLDEDEERAILTALLNREERRRAKRDHYNAFLVGRRQSPLLDRRTAAFTDHLLPMFVLSRETGLRLRELAMQVWGNVDLVAKCIYVRAPTAKTREPRAVGLSDLAVEVLIKWKAQSRKARADVYKTRKDGTGKALNGDWVFPSPQDAQNHITSPKAAFKRVLREAGITDFVWRDLRHDFASHLAMEDVSLYAISDALGHKNLATTKRYAHLSPSYRLNTVGALDRRRARLSQQRSSPGQAPAA